MTDSKQCLELSLQSVASQIKASDGRQIPFTRAVLMIRNVCNQAVTIVPQAMLGQEGGTVQDVTRALAHSADSSIPAGGTVSWDVYDLLLPAHQGTASKMHMFGYRAALNWRFELAAWATYRTSASSESKTPALQWSLTWSISDPASGAVGLTIEEVKA
jgi:hypothetical protein